MAELIDIHHRTWCCAWAVKAQSSRYPHAIIHLSAALLTGILHVSAAAPPAKRPAHAMSRLSSLPPLLRDLLQQPLQSLLRCVWPVPLHLSLTARLHPLPAPRLRIIEPRHHALPAQHMPAVRHAHRTARHGRQHRALDPALHHAISTAHTRKGEEERILTTT